MNKISIKRKELGLSQAAFAQVLGWGRSRLSNYEAGSREPGLNECRHIVSTLNNLGNSCTIDDIFPQTIEEN